jgi:hypothetical protein
VAEIILQPRYRRLGSPAFSRRRDADVPVVEPGRLAQPRNHVPEATRGEQPGALGEQTDISCNGTAFSVLYKRAQAAA